MIDIQLTELDLSLEVADQPEYQIDLSGSSGNLPLLGPIDFSSLEVQSNDWGLLDLDLLGFPYHGLSAYEIAVKNGFVGTEAQWLASLVGPPGTISQEGYDLVEQARSYAQSAAGSAFAASGSAYEAYTYSGVAGVHATASQTHSSEARVYRDETGQFANAVATLRLEVEAYATDAGEYAYSANIAKNAAETSRAEAEVLRNQAATSRTSAESAAASATDQVNAAVTARNQAEDYADAAFLSKSEANAYADDARVEANASRMSQIAATAAKDDAEAVAAGVVIHVDNAQAYADDARSWAQASETSKLGADAAFGNAQNSAAAALTQANRAEAEADAAGTSAQVATDQKLLAQTAAGNASASAGAAATSATNALGSRNQAYDYSQLAATASSNAGQSAAAAVTSRNQAEAFADAAGTLYGAVSSSLTSLTARVQDVEGDITTVQNITISNRDKINLTYGVNLNANGYMTGWKASNDGTTGNFTVVGNEFFLVDNSGGTPFSPFNVVGNQATFNANVRINGNLIVTGTVDTPAIKERAVTGVAAAYNSGSVVLTHNTPKRVHGLYINVEQASSPIDIDFNCWATFTHDGGGSFTAFVQLVRSRNDTGGEVLLTIPIYGSGMANDTWQGAVPIKYLDKPNATGQWHYYIQFYTNVNNMTVQNVTARYGKLIEMKNNPSVTIATGTGDGTGVGSGGGSGGGGGTVIPPGGGGGGGGIEMPVIET